MYRFNHHTGDNSLRGRETSIDSLSPSNIAVLADAHGKPMQAKGDNDAAKSSGRIC